MATASSEYLCGYDEGTLTATCISHWGTLLYETYVRWSEKFGCLPSWVPQLTVLQRETCFAMDLHCLDDVS